MAKSAPTVENMEDESEVEVPIEEATHQQLMWFSKQQNLDVDEAETHSQTLVRLRTAWDHATIRVPKVIEAESKPVGPAAPTGGEDAQDRYGLPLRVVLKVHSIGDEGQITHEFAHNGRAYIAEVGKEITLPWYVFKGCFMDAQESRYQSGKDTGIGEPRTVQAVSYTRIK